MPSNQGGRSRRLTLAASVARFRGISSRLARAITAGVFEGDEMLPVGISGSGRGASAAEWKLPQGLDKMAPHYLAGFDSYHGVCCCRWRLGAEHRRQCGCGSCKVQRAYIRAARSGAKAVPAVV